MNEPSQNKLRKQIRTWRTAGARTLSLIHAGYKHVAALRPDAGGARVLLLNHGGYKHVAALRPDAGGARVLLLNHAGYKHAAALRPDRWPCNGSRRDQMFIDGEICRAKSCGAPAERHVHWRTLGRSRG